MMAFDRNMYINEHCLRFYVSKSIKGAIQNTNQCFLFKLSSDWFQRNWNPTVSTFQTIELTNRKTFTEWYKIWLAHKGDESPNSRVDFDCHIGRGVAGPLFLGCLVERLGVIDLRHLSSFDKIKICNNVKSFMNSLDSSELNVTAFETCFH